MLIPIAVPLAVRAACLQLPLHHDLDWFLKRAIERLPEWFGQAERIARWFVEVLVLAVAVGALVVVLGEDMKVQNPAAWGLAVLYVHVILCPAGRRCGRGNSRNADATT